MKKSVKNLVVMLCVLVALGGCATVLILTNNWNKEEEAASSSSSTVSTEQEMIVDKQAADVAEIKVKNAKGEFTLEPAETVDSDASETEETQFTIREVKGYDINNSLATTSANSVYSVAAAKNLGVQEDLGAFGLSGEGEAKVVLTYKDGTEDTLILGSQSGGTTGRYVLKDGTVYISSSPSENLFKNELAYFNTSIYSVADRTSESAAEISSGAPESSASSGSEELADILYHFTLTGKNYPKPVEIKYEPAKFSEYVMVSPVKAESGTSKFKTLVTNLKSLEADTVADYGVTGEKLAEYGLDVPHAQLVFEMNTETHTLKVGAVDENGYRYLMADDSDVVYVVESDKVKDWADGTTMDFKSTYIWLPNITNVKKLTLTAAGTEHVYNIDRTENEEKSTESNKVWTMLPKTAAGKDVPYDSYQPFYQKLIGISVLNVDEKDYTAENPVFSANYEYFDGTAADNIAFYPLEGEDRYAVELNGEYAGVVRKTSVDEIVAAIPDMEAGVVEEESSASSEA